MADDQEFSLLGGSMLSEEQFHKMMADEGTKMQEEAQLRLAPRIGPSDLPYTPSPPLVPEVTPRLPTPPPRGPFSPLPEGQPGPAEPPLAPPQQLPAPPRPLRRMEANLRPNMDYTPEERGRRGMNEIMDGARDANEGGIMLPRGMPTTPGTPLAPDEQNPTRAPNGLIITQNTPFSNLDGERRSPEAAFQSLKQGMVDEAAKRRLAAENGPQPNVAQRFAGEFLNTAMALVPGGPRGGGTPFARSMPRVSLPENPFVASPTKGEGTYIQSAAVRNPEGKVTIGDNHGDAWVKAGNPDVPFNEKGFTDGFITNEGKFVDRFEGKAIAEGRGQTMRERADPHDVWYDRLTSDELMPDKNAFTRAEGNAKLAQRDEGQMSPNERVQRGFGDQGGNGNGGNGGDGGGKPPKGKGVIQAAREKGADELPAVDPTTGRPIPPQVRRGRPPKGAADNPEASAKDPGRFSQRTDPEAPNYVRNGDFRKYGEQGEIGRKDSALRSVKRTGVPAEEALTKNLEAFPEGYFDRVPRERRQMGTGLSHPGFRWQILEDGAPIGTPQMNKIKASQRADKMSSTYEKQYTVAPRPAGEGELTQPERSYLQKYEINIPRRGR